MTRTVRASAPARAGLVGNPSDGYGGRVIAVAIDNFAAHVTIAEGDGVSIAPPAADLPGWRGFRHLLEDSARYGHDGAVRLVRAALVVFAEHCARLGISIGDGLTISYETSIPRQVGLSGSSAIIVATQAALCEWYDVEFPIELRPSLALAAETDELNLTAGLQDRVAQVYGGVVAMDFDPEHTKWIDGHPHGRYEQLDAEWLPQLFVSHLDQAAEPSQVIHGDLRRRYDTGDATVVSAMRKLASLAAEAHAALRWRDTERFGSLIDQSFETRRQVMDLAPAQVAMVDAARGCDANAGFAGSGGAIVGTWRDQEHLAAITAALSAVGAHTEAIRVAPPTSET